MHGLRRYLLLLLLLLLLLAAPVLTGCTDTDGDSDGQGERVPVAFATYLPRMVTARGDVTMYGNAGAMTEQRLRDEGFGVMAFYTDDNDFATAGNIAPNFMYNQQVYYRFSQAAWLYAPTKYWPNERGQDDSDGRTDRLSFFAYAPYTATFDDDRYDGGNGYGVTLMSGNTTTSTAMHLAYHTSFTDPTKQLDLMYATAVDQVKQRTGEAVTLQFRHALAQVDFTVQGVFDDDTPGGNNIDPSSRILVESVTLPGNCYPQKGNFYFAKQTPTWGDYGDYTSLSFTSDIDASLRAVTIGTAPTDAYVTAEDLFADEDLTGVTNTAVPLAAAGTEPLSIIPCPVTSDNVVEVVYKVYTYDPNLVRNTPPRVSIVTNTIRRALPITAFEPNKHYTINLLLGMTTAKMTLTIQDLSDGSQKEVDVPANGVSGGGGSGSIGLMVSPNKALGASGAEETLSLFELTQAEARELVGTMNDVGGAESGILSSTSSIRVKFRITDSSAWYLYIKDGGGWNNIFARDVWTNSDMTTGSYNITESLSSQWSNLHSFANNDAYWTEGVKRTFIKATGKYVEIEEVELIP